MIEQYALFWECLSYDAYKFEMYVRDNNVEQNDKIRNSIHPLVDVWV